MELELPIALAALLLAVVALGLARRPSEPPAPPEDLDARARLAALEARADQLGAELRELRASLEAAPPPPLPKRRSGGLDDLREQLRASAREPDDEPERPR